MAKKIIDQLVDYMLVARDAPLPGEVAQRAKNHILDTLAAIVSGSQLTPGRMGIEFARLEGGKPEALVMGSDLLTTATLAAFANGISAHADESDDSTIDCIRAARFCRRRGPLPNGKRARARLYSTPS